MSVIRGVFSGPERRSLGGAPWVTGETVPGPLQDSFGFGPLLRITETAALRVAAVWACVRVNADALAAAPVDVYRKEGATRRQLDPPSVITDPAAGLMTAHDWWFALVASLQLVGNAYALKADLDPQGYPRALPLWDPTQVHAKVVGGRIESYRYAGQDYPADRVLHLRAFTLPGRPLGVSPLEQFGQTIGMAAAAERFAYQFFSEGAIPSAILYSDQELNAEQSASIKQRIMQAWRWRREPAVLGSGLKYERVSVNPDEAQFIESQHFSIEEICRIFGVPPEKIGHSSSGSNVTYANVEQRQIGYLQDTLLPWAARIETALSTCLPRPQFVKVNLDSLIRVDLLTRYKAHGMSLRDGWENADAVRALEDKAPMPDKQGETFLWPLVAKPTQEPPPEAAPTGGGA